MPAADAPFTLTALGHGLAASPGSVPFALEPAVESGESSGLVGVGGVRKTLAPALNKFHVGNGDDGKHYWLTPPDLYAELDAEFRFDFDPCPWPKPDDFDGLTCEWGMRNWVNPPFGSIMHNGRKKGPTAWMRKAIAEQAKGKTSVVVYPVDKWVLMMLKATAAPNVRNLGDVRWCATEDGSQGKGTGRHIAAFILLGGGGAELVTKDFRRHEGEALNDPSSPTESA